MARVAVPRGAHSGLYAALLEREEAEERAVVARGFGKPGTAMRLAALRAGEPVDMRAEICQSWRGSASQRIGGVGPSSP